MEIASQPGYVEELSMHQLSPAQYLAAAQKAVTELRWYIVQMNNESMACITQNDYYAVGEVVTIMLKDKKVIVRSTPRDPYSWSETQNRDNVELFKLAILRAVAEQEKTNRSLHPMHREKYGALVPSKTYLVTPLLVYSNVLVYIAMFFAGISPLQPTTQSLFAWGGNFRPAVASGEWWRLLSYMFLHAGGMHLLMNTFALLYIGMFLEPLMGKFRFISAYILTGICAGLLSITMHGNGVGVGASGAIFGMYGVFFAILTTGHIQKTMRKTMLRSILFFIVLNLLLGLQGNTDNAAHIGGLLSGIVFGYLYYPGIAKHASWKKQLLTVAVSASVVILLTILTLVRI